MQWKQTRGEVILVVVVLASPTLAEDIVLTPEKLDLKSEPCGDGWQVWSGIGDLEGAVTYRERITALIAHANDVWAGTSHGRLLTHSAKGWVLQGQLKGIQVTGNAVENADKVWLSTNDGIRRLDREGQQLWKVNEFRHYYEGHPSFVSGGYIPGEDAERLWGYVDDIYFSRRKRQPTPPT